MKQTNNWMGRVILSAVLFMFYAVSLYATQLNGTYTIDPAATTAQLTAGTHFRDLSSAVTYLTSTATRADGGPSNSGTVGISGPVVFKIAPATYTLSTSFTVPAISTSSALNTITFDGGTGNAAAVIITGSISGQALIKLNLCKYVNFRNVTIRNTFSGSCSGIAIIGSNSNNSGTGCSIRKCIVTLTGTGTNANAYGILTTATASGNALSATRMDSILIDSNSINGGSRGIVFSGSTSYSSNYNRMVRIKQNEVNNPYSHGISVTAVCDGIEISGNRIDMNSANNENSYGIALEECRNQSALRSHRIIGNRIFNAGAYGLYTYNSSSFAVTPTRIYNNMIIHTRPTTGLYAYGIYLWSGLSFINEVYHNSVHMLEGGLSGAQALYYYSYINPVNGMLCRNNIFSCNTNSHVDIPVYFETNPSGNVLDYNVYYNKSSTDLLMRTIMYKKTSYQSVAGGGVNSFNEVPGFVSSSDLHLTQYCAPKGLDLTAAVAQDIDFYTRPVSPSIGCAEVPLPFIDNLGVHEISKPTFPFSPGLQDIVVKIRNNGSSIVSSFNYHYIINGIGSGINLWTGTLLPCHDTTIIISGVNLGGSTSFVFYTDGPNSNPDPEKINDTIRVTLNAGLTGTYSIGGFSPDFATIQDAVSALHTRGVNGPVTMLIAPGDYIGPITMYGAIPGSSDINTVTFDGTDAVTTRILGGVANTAVLFLQNCSYVHFRNITVRSTVAAEDGITSGIVFSGTHITTPIRNCGVHRCIVELPLNAQTNSTGILVTGAESPSLWGTEIAHADTIIIDSNIIYGGWNGIAFYGTDGNHFQNKIRFNKVDKVNSIGIRISKIKQGLEVSYNNVNMDSLSTEGGQAGIEISECESNIQESLTVIGNKVKNAAAVGIAVYDCGAGFLVKIHNNMVTGGFRSDDAPICGLCVTNGLVEVYHNTFITDYRNSSLSINTPVLSVMVSDSSVYKNNIFAHIGNKGSGSAVPAYFFGMALVSGMMDYNLHFNETGPELLTNVIGNFTEIDYNTAAVAGVSAMNFKPPFSNDSSYMEFTNNCVVKGYPLLGSVPLDIKGRVRTQSLIGASEPPLVTNDLALVKILHPSMPITLGLQPLELTVQNTGSVILTNFEAGYSLNKDTPVTTSWTGILNPCDTISIIFSGQISLSRVNDISAFISVSGQNTNVINDTIKASYLQPLSGIYSLGDSTADFLDFKAATYTLNRAGVVGPVTFLVKPGTYSQQLEIVDSIPGSSSVNTVTFDGISASSCIITYSAMGNGDNYTLRSDQNYTRFRNFTIKATGSNYGWAVSFPKPGCKNIHIKNCIIETGNQNSENFAGIVMNSTTSLSYMGGSNLLNNIYVDSIEIDSNTILNGWAGIVNNNSDIDVDFFPVAIPSDHFFIRHNIIKHSAAFGIRLVNTNHAVIDNNIIDLQRTDQSLNTGIYCDYTSRTADSSGYFITSNTIRNIGSAGMIITRLKSDLSFVANNVILGGFKRTGAVYGMYMDADTGFHIYHNTVNIDAYHNDDNGNISGAPSSGLFINNTRNIDIRNNHFIVSKNGLISTYPVFISNLSFISALDYNNYYSTDTTKLLFLFNALTPSNFRGGLGRNTHSFFVNPNFQNDTLLRLNSGCMNGDPAITAEVPLDIEGNIRTGSPDIGAYEIPVVANDLSVEALLNPAFPLDTILQSITVRIINLGSNTITGSHISYRLNNDPEITEFWSGSLMQCDTMSFTFSTNVNILPGVINRLKVFTGDPNFASADDNKLNDTLHVTLAMPLSGIYTIGGVAPDFSSFTAAAEALNKYGINGPVLFNVRTGTYIEQMKLTRIAGSSTINSIVFKSEVNHKDSVKLQYNSYLPSENYVVAIDNVSNCSIKQMTLSAGGVNYSRVIEFNGTVSFDTIIDCNLQAVATLSAVAGADKAIIIGQLVSGQGIVIRNNKMLNGTYGIYLSGNGTHLSCSVIDSNRIEGSYMGGVVLQDNKYPLIQNNSVLASNYLSYNGISLTRVDSSFKVTGNRIKALKAGKGIFNTQCKGLPILKALIANNIITSVASGTNPCAGLWTVNSNDVAIYHNTVCMNIANVQAYAAGFEYTGVVSNDIRNNIFANYSSLGYCMYFVSPTPIGAFDYNNLYSASSGLVKQPTSEIGSFGAWKNAFPAFFGYDKNSVSYRPPFADPFDPLPNPFDTAVWALNGRGAHLDSNLLKTDFTGSFRPLTYAEGVPDIGAHEVTPAMGILPPLATAVPAISLPGQIQNFLFAGDTVGKITWDINATPGAVRMRQYTGTQPPYIDSSDNHMFMYATIDMPGWSTFYNLDLFYKDGWIGTNPSEADIRLIRISDMFLHQWSLLTTGNTINTANNILSASSLFDTSAMYTGTDMNNPLPVKLITFQAHPVADDVYLNWSTASEINSDRFDVERSIDGKTFYKIGTVRSKGGSLSARYYQFVDHAILLKQPLIYYRLKMIDANEVFQYSDLVSVKRNAERFDVSIFPNPYFNDINLNVFALADQEAIIVVSDVYGKNVLEKSSPVLKGSHILQIEGMQDLNKGVYFVTITLNGEIKVIKLIHR
jgi:parallel beta-helix repeat protein